MNVDMMMYAIGRRRSGRRTMWVQSKPTSIVQNVNTPAPPAEKKEVQR